MLAPWLMRALAARCRRSCQRRWGRPAVSRALARPRRVMLRWSRWAPVWEQKTKSLGFGEPSGEGFFLWVARSRLRRGWDGDVAFRGFGFGFDEVAVSVELVADADEARL